MEELKPCPFCGGKASVEQVDSYKYPGKYWWVMCDCGVILSKDLHNSFSTEAEAIQAWNTRHERTCKPRFHNSYFAPCDCGYGVYFDMNYCPKCGSRVVKQ